MLQKIIDLYYKAKIKRNLLCNKREDLAIFETLEPYLTMRILEGQKERRPELTEIQRKIEETKRFIKFIKKL